MFDSVSNFTRKFSSQISTAVGGLQTLQNFDCSLHNGDASDSSMASDHRAYGAITPVRPIDLAYLNNFRIFIFAEPHSSNAQMVKLHRYIYFPKIDFQLRQISQPFKIVNTPLTSMLTKKSARHDRSGLDNLSSSSKKKKMGLKFGFLTLDQNQRMLPFMASDPISRQVPLIGAWV